MLLINKQTLNKTRPNSSIPKCRRYLINVSLACVLITPNEYECLWVMQERISENFVCTWGIVGGSPALVSWDPTHRGCWEEMDFDYFDFSPSATEGEAPSQGVFAQPCPTRPSSCWWLSAGDGAVAACRTRHQGCSARRSGNQFSKNKVVTQLWEGQCRVPFGF